MPTERQWWALPTLRIKYPVVVYDEELLFRQSTARAGCDANQVLLFEVAVNEGRASRESFASRSRCLLETAKYKINCGKYLASLVIEVQNPAPKFFYRICRHFRD